MLELVFHLKMPKTYATRASRGESDLLCFSGKFIPQNGSEMD